MNKVEFTQVEHVLNMAVNKRHSRCIRYIKLWNSAMGVCYK